MTNSIHEIQRKRFQFLQKLHETTDGNESESVHIAELGAKLGFSDSESEKIYNYLHGQGLISDMDLVGNFSITHRGIIEYEKALSRPNEPTSFFPPINYIHVEQMIGSQIQQGSSQSSQALTLNNNDIEAILKFVSGLRSQLPELKLGVDVEAEVISDISTIESQAKSPRPKFKIIMECLSSIKSVLEGIAGNAIAALLLQRIGTLPK